MKKINDNIFMGKKYKNDEKNAEEKGRKKTD